jgi:hypothetical protein
MVKHAPFWGLFLVTCWALSGSPTAVRAGDGPGQRVDADTIVRMDAAQRASALAALDAERASVADGLLRVGLDETRDGDDRVAAVLALARCPTGPVIQACLDRLHVRIRKERLVFDDDREKEFAFRAALREMGLACLGEVLAWVGQADRSVADLDAVASVVVRVLGRARAPTIVQSWEGGEPQRTRLRALAERLAGK